MVSFCKETLNLNERRTSDDCIDARLSREISQGIQQEFDGEILVSQLMLDRFALFVSIVPKTTLVTETKKFLYFLFQDMANQAVRMVKGIHIFQERGRGQSFGFYPFY